MTRASAGVYLQRADWRRSENGRLRAEGQQRGNAMPTTNRVALTNAYIGTAFVCALSLSLPSGNTPGGEAGAGAAKVPVEKLADADAKTVRTLLAEFKQTADAARRDELVKLVLDYGPVAAKLLRDEVDRLWDAKVSEYTEELGKQARQVYLQKLASLTDDQIRQIQIDRFCFTVYFEGFKPAAEKTSPMVATEWRKPDWNKDCQAGFKRLRELLLLPVEQVAQGPLSDKRQTLLKLCDHRTQCAKALPTVAVPPKKAPTGLEYPPMDRAPTAVEKLQRVERAVIMANTVAGPENDKILLENERLAEDLDVEEARAFMHMNERRLLAGSNATRIDVLLTIAARDHSIDLAEHKNNAGGHFSDKGGFVERTKRFGTRWASAEGVGGGANGPNAVDGLSYGGGHTGAIYGPQVTETGIGRHGGAFTFIYAHGARRTPWYDDGFFLPPGIAVTQLPPFAKSVNDAIGKGPCAVVKPVLAKRDTWVGKADVEAVTLRFLASYVELQIDHELGKMEARHRCGDWYGLWLTHQQAVARLKGFERFDAGAKEYETALQDKANAKELETGHRYGAFEQAATQQAKTKDKNAAAQLRQQLAAALTQFAQQNEGSIYAKAASTALKKLEDEGVSVRDALRAYLTQETAKSELFAKGASAEVADAPAAPAAAPPASPTAPATSPGPPKTTEPAAKDTPAKTTPASSRALAVSPDALEQWQARLIKKVDALAKAGTKLSMRVPGQENAVVRGATEKGLTVSVQGNDLPLAWKQVALEDRAALAKEAVRVDDVETLLIAAVYQLAVGNANAAEDLFAKAALKDPEAVKGAKAGLMPR